MNKERFGTFIAQRRRELGLTQRDLAQALHLTDKAVSKWERGLSYPDVTLLEPLAAKLELTVGELMACCVGAAAPETEKEEPMETLMTISKDTVRRERRRSWQRLIGVLVLLAAAGAVIAWNAVMVSETQETSIFLKETQAGKGYLYVEREGHLLKLKCGSGVDFDAIPLENEWGDPISYRMDCRWNRLTHTGVVTSCTDTGMYVLGGLMDVTFSSSYFNFVLGYPCLQYNSENYYPDPYAEPRGHVYLCDYRFWVEDPNDGTEETILTVEDCLNATAGDTDGDGENELIIRTRWPEKPYTAYDCVDGEITETWPDTVPEEIQDALRCIWEE